MLQELRADEDLETPGYTEETSTFGDRLTFSRENVGVSQEFLANRIGVKTKTLREWEDDLSEPEANRLQMVAGMLNVSMGWLMSGNGQEPAGLNANADIDFRACLAELRKLRSEQTVLLSNIKLLEKRFTALIE